MVQHVHVGFVQRLLRFLRMAVGAELSRAGGIFSKAYTAFHALFRAVRRFYTAVVVLVFVNLTMNLRANGGNPYIARLGGRFDFFVKAKSDGGFARSRIRSAGDGNPFLFGQLTLRFFQRVGGFDRPFALLWRGRDQAVRHP